MPLGGGGYPRHRRGHIDIWSKIEVHKILNNPRIPQDTLWPRKPYRFFMCHHKADAGNLARLLKMELVKRTGNFKVGRISPLLYVF